MISNLKYIVGKSPLSKCRLLLVLLLLSVSGFINGLMAQEGNGLKSKVAVGTNTLSWLTLAPNAEIDFQISSRLTVGANVAYKPWHVLDDNKKIMGINVNPDIKYWFCRPYYKHYLGLAANYANYNGGLKDYRYQGHLWGGSVIYGYQMIISEHWNLEFSLGIGYCRMNHDKYYREVCGDYIGHEKKNYFGPTRLGISFVRVF